jgi:hypothetical protein
MTDTKFSDNKLLRLFRGAARNGNSDKLGVGPFAVCKRLQTLKISKELEKPRIDRGAGKLITKN